MTRILPSPHRLALAARFHRAPRPPVEHTAAPAPTGAAPIARTWLEARAAIAAVLILQLGEVQARRLLLLADLTMPAAERAMTGIGAAR